LKAAQVVCCALLLLHAAASPADESLRLSLKLSDPALATAAPAARLSAQPLPALRVPAARDYRIGAEDLLEIQVFGVEQLTRTVRVNSAGAVSLPLVGTLQMSGLTSQEAEALLAAKLAADYLQNPQVSLFIKEYTTQRVTVEGAVQKPGIYPLRGQTTLLRTLAIAGGQGNLSDMNEVMLFRADASGQRVAQVFDVERIRRGEADDPAVVNDDVIVVNRSKARAFLKDSVVRDVIDAINPFSPLAR
jgi:polysaccharide biosynthesis/export protein